MIIRNLKPAPNPADSYAEAVRRIEILQAKDTPEVNRVCFSHFMTHRQKVERAIVLWHGFTNCPQQFYELGKTFFDTGYNVLIPRVPHHGFIDPLTPAHAQLTARELATLTNEAVDIAQGLGDQVTVAGISMGGILTAWAAQHRSDIEQAVIISPAFGLRIVPVRLSRLIMNLFLISPNFFRWWDTKLKADSPRPIYVYPRLSSRGLSEIFRLGALVQRAARRSKPAAQSILVVTNANDTAVNNKLTATVVQRWRRQGANLRTYEFEAALDLTHDLIDPGHVAQRIDLVYPVLVDLMTEAHPG